MERFLEPGDQLGIWDNKPREIQGGLDHLWNLIGRRWGEKVQGCKLENWEKGFSKGWTRCQDPHLKKIRIPRTGQGEVGDWEERRHTRRVQLCKHVDGWDHVGYDRILTQGSVTYPRTYLLMGIGS